MTARTEEGTFEALSSAECLGLLRSHRFGRVGVVAGGQPMVFPVNYVLDVDIVVFRTAPGTMLAGSAIDRVCFEIDGIDENRRSGWSVMVQGVGHEITDALDERSVHLRQLEVDPWVPGANGHWVAIRPERITGRRLVP